MEMEETRVRKYWFIVSDAVGSHMCTGCGMHDSSISTFYGSILEAMKYIQKVGTIGVTCGQVLGVDGVSYDNIAQAINLLLQLSEPA